MSNPFSYTLRPSKDLDYVVSASSDSDSEPTCKQKKRSSKNVRVTADTVTKTHDRESDPAYVLKIRAQTRERMKQYRQRIKEEYASASTRKQIEHVEEAMVIQRAKWRAQKQKEKKVMSPKDVNKKNAKRRLGYLKRQLKKGKVPRNAANAIVLPLTPRKYVDTVINLIKTSTPRKKALFKKYGYLRNRRLIKKIERNARVIALVKERLKELKKSQRKEDRKNYQFLVSTASGKQVMDRTLSKSFGICAKTWLKYSTIDTWERNSRSDAMTEEDHVGIHTFYRQHSSLLSGTRYNTKEGKQKMVLNVTTEKLHRNFQQLFGKTISLSRFRKDRPSYVLCVAKHRFNTSLCEYCINIEHKIQALGKLSKEINISMPAKDKYELSDLTVCSYEHVPAQECINRTCKKCGTSNLKIAFKDFGMEKTLLWKVWSTQKFHPSDKKRAKLEVSSEAEKEQGKDDEKTEQAGEKKGISKKVLTEKSTLVSDLVNQLCNDMDHFTSHLFTAKWQREQMKELQGCLPDGWILTIEDFSENFRTCFQDKIK
jgi:hypothetical protein